jgi:hypothetical protein
MITGLAFYPLAEVNYKLRVNSVNTKQQIRLCVEHTLWSNVFLWCHDLMDNLIDWFANEDVHSDSQCTTFTIPEWCAVVTQRQEYSCARGLFWFYSLVLRKTFPEDVRERPKEIKFMPATSAWRHRWLVVADCSNSDLKNAFVGWFQMTYFCFWLIWSDDVNWWLIALFFCDITNT